MLNKGTSGFTIWNRISPVLKLARTDLVAVMEVYDPNHTPGPRLMGRVSLYQY